MSSERAPIDDKEDELTVKYERKEGEPTSAFKGASWGTLLIGVAA